MASNLLVWRDNFSRGLRDKRHPWTPVFDVLEKRTGVDRLYLCIGFMGFFLLYMVFGYAAQLICNIFGFMYPAYASIKALETLKKEDDTKWLTYWVVFAFFSIIEFFSGFILHWFPFYWLLKCGQVLLPWPWKVLVTTDGGKVASATPPPGPVSNECPYSTYGASYPLKITGPRSSTSR